MSQMFGVKHFRAKQLLVDTKKQHYSLLSVYVYLLLNRHIYNLALKQVF